MSSDSPYLTAAIRKRTIESNEGWETTIRLCVPFCVLCLLIAGCGSSSGQAVESAPPMSADPISCLQDAGLSHVEQQDADSWRGDWASPFYQVSVQEMASEADATSLVNEATDVYAAQGGRYVVTGPAKPEAGGLLSSSEAATANSSNVSQIASCLGG
jgi:hypothetical protein